MHRDNEALLLCTADLPKGPDSVTQYTSRALALRTLNASGLDYVVAGAYALREYAGIMRDTKDLDLFVERKDVERCLEALANAGFRTEITDPVWLAKGFHACGEFIDVIFSSGNGVADVDELWMKRSRPAVVLGVPSRIAPPEEIIWSKAFVCERERYDGADVNHVLKYCIDEIDWDHLLWRFEPHPEVLLSHLLLFRYSYPGLRARIPTELIERLYEQCRKPAKPGEEQLCRGTLLSRAQYAIDLRAGMVDARKVEVNSFREYHNDENC
jgi:hypothetical protein